MTKNLKQIKDLLYQYYREPLDCDGQTRVMHYVLSEAKIQHDLYFGAIEVKDADLGFFPHMWIQLAVQEGLAAVDYKARKWLGKSEKIPHGVFLLKDYPHVQYNGDIVYEEPKPAFVIQFLLGE